MEEQNPTTPSETPVPSPAPAPAVHFDPPAMNAEAASPYRPLVAAMLVSALLVAGALLGSSYMLAEKIEGIRAQLGDIGGAPAAPRPTRGNDGEDGPPKVVDVSKIITSADPSRGPKDAKVTIVEFSDYECPFCNRFYEETLPVLLKEYEGKVRFVWKDFPLPMHSNAPKASEGAHCAAEQGKYWEYHDLLFSNQRQMSTDDLMRHAEQIGLDKDDFSTCLNSNKYARKVSKDLEEGRSLGVSGTPTFFINGERLVGAQPVGEFKRRIDAILAN